MTLEEFQVESKKRKVGRGRKPQPYTNEQKIFATSFAKTALSDGVSRSVIIRKLGISATALKKWMGPHGEATPVKGNGPKFKRVKMSIETRVNDEGPTLITPSGYRVEGMSLENLVYLLRMI